MRESVCVRPSIPAPATSAQQHSLAFPALLHGLRQRIGKLRSRGFLSLIPGLFPSSLFLLWVFLPLSLQVRFECLKCCFRRDSSLMFGGRRISPALVPHTLLVGQSKTNQISVEMCNPIKDYSFFAQNYQYAQRCGHERVGYKYEKQTDSKLWRIIKTQQHVVQNSEIHTS